VRPSGRHEEKPGIPRQNAYPLRKVEIFSSSLELCEKSREPPQKGGKLLNPEAFPGKMWTVGEKSG